MTTVTVDQVLDWHPCAGYDRERIITLFAGRETLAALDILNLDIAPADKLWAVLRNEFFSDEQLHCLACDFAEHVVYLCGDDPRPRAAIEAKRGWLRGEVTDDELAAARYAAREDAWDAAMDAARAAAMVARAAARGAARDAEFEWQLERIKMLVCPPIEPAQQEAEIERLQKEARALTGGQGW